MYGFLLQKVSTLHVVEIYLYFAYDIVSYSKGGMVVKEEINLINKMECQHTMPYFIKGENCKNYLHLEKKDLNIQKKLKNI